MGWLNILKRQTPEEFYSSFSDGIIVNAAAFQASIETFSTAQSIQIFEEFACYLLHWVDRYAYAEIGKEGRNILFDNVATGTISKYPYLLIDDEQKQDSAGDAFCDTLERRQVTYSNCKVNEEGVAGSMEFALACYIHQVVHGTCPEKLVDTITKNGEVAEEDDVCLPHPNEVLRITIFSHEYLKSLDIKKRLKQFVSICNI